MGTESCELAQSVKLGIEAFNTEMGQSKDLCGRREKEQVDLDNR